MNEHLWLSKLPFGIQHTTQYTGFFGIYQINCRWNTFGSTKRKKKTCKTGLRERTFWAHLNIAMVFHVRKDIKEAIRSRKLKDRQYHGHKRKRKKGQTTIFITFHRKLNIEHHEHYKKIRYSGMIVSSCVTSDTRRVTLATNPWFSSFLVSGNSIKEIMIGTKPQAME